MLTYPSSTSNKVGTPTEWWHRHLKVQPIPGHLNGWKSICLQIKVSQVACGIIHGNILRLDMFSIGISNN
jgi:hypothetical protein